MRGRGHRDRGLRPWRAVRGLLRPVPDVQPGGRAQRQPGLVRPALSAALAAGRRGGLSPVHEGPVRHLGPGTPSGRGGGQPQDRGPPQAGGVRGRHRGGLPAGSGRAVRRGTLRRAASPGGAGSDVQPRRLHPGLRSRRGRGGADVPRPAEPHRRAGGGLPPGRPGDAGQGRAECRRAGAAGPGRGRAREARRRGGGDPALPPGPEGRQPDKAGERGADAGGAGAGGRRAPEGSRDGEGRVEGGPAREADRLRRRPYGGGRRGCRRSGHGPGLRYGAGDGPAAKDRRHGLRPFRDRTGRGRERLLSGLAAERPAAGRPGGAGRGPHERTSGKQAV